MTAFTSNLKGIIIKVVDIKMDHRKANELINTTGYFLILNFQSQSLITVFDPYTILVSLLVDLEFLSYVYIFLTFYRLMV